MGHEFAFDQLGPVAAPDADPIGAALAQADAIRAAAHEEGFAAGLAAGEQAARAELVPAAEALAAATAQARELAQHSIEASERAAVELGLAIAEKALAGALEVQPERVVDVVTGALRRLIERERVLVLVHPDDLALVRDAIGEVCGSLGGIEHFEVQAERRMERGGAIVRTAEGEVDARLEAKLERVRELLAAELAG